MNIDSIRLVLYIMMIEFPFGLLFSAEGQDCSGSCSVENYWCGVSPGDYAMVNVTEDQPGRIVCTISYTTGQDILVVNHLGEEVRTSADLSDYVQQLPMDTDTQQTDNKSYELNIMWTQDSQIQERLKLLQCIAIFHGTSHLCKTSIVNLQFISNQATNPADMTTAAGGDSSSTSTPSSTDGASNSRADSTTTTSTASDASSTTSSCTNVILVTSQSAGQTQFHNHSTKTSTLSSLALLLTLLISVTFA